ncbi:hypothetical protein ACSBR2_020489 [Camellia fascicularis]
MQFADDSILFCDAYLVEVENLKRILRCFEIISGLRINYHKSVVWSVGVPNDILSSFASKLNCKVQFLPLKYLGRLTLIKSVVSSFPIYYLSLFKMPEGVAKEIKNLQASF